MARLPGLLIAVFAVSALAYHIEQAPSFHLDQAMFQQQASEKRSYTDLINLIQTGGFNQENNQVNEFLAGMKKDLLEEEAQHDQLHAKQTQECEEEEVFRTKEISDGRKSRAASKVQRDLCEAERNEAKSIEAIGEAGITSNQNLLDELIRERKAQVEEYKSRKAALGKLAGVFQEMISMIDQFVSAAEAPVPTAFLQKMNVLLAMSIKFNKYEQVMPLYNSFMQMTANPNDVSFSVEDVTAVREQVKTLQENYENAEKELEEEEVANLAAFKARKATLEDLIAGYTNQRNRAIAYGKKMQACFEQESDIYRMADEKVKNNVALRKHAREMCQADAEKYRSVKKAIDRELRLLTQLEYAIKQLGADYANKVLPKANNLINVTETGDDNDGIDETYDNADTGGLEAWEQKPF